ncbi:hypothetical protein DDL59_10870 [Neisseria gonorrhoeae]|uniref:Uncharacterized protein n=1 Tax=Neisseria gonorrhoeae TaxID=485 RepID=A0AAX2TPD2_NEIGO|nr:hypothetical protein A6J43_05865 [Neisseria gonorrhoeae]ARC02357.1 hypothetical protein A6J44_09855 [Neisseria gonorrhoeae]ARC04550.1 hypothetical protein A6J46_07820 [Neisseria gonorrhoeae]ASQ72555.1 hypothetical protein BZG33_05725 [Neisseria gonorrhoeae]ASQ74845.1 hypothetical protein BZG34_03805 [Neisseria gonorrhoeae]
MSAASSPCPDLNLIHYIFQKLKPAQIVKPQNRGGRNSSGNGFMQTKCHLNPENRASDGICVFADGGF